MQSRPFFRSTQKMVVMTKRIRNRKSSVERGRKAEENRGEKEVIKLRFDINDIFLLRDSLSHWRIRLIKGKFFLSKSFS